jgi:hypothetical protein
MYTHTECFTRFASFSIVYFSVGPIYIYIYIYIYTHTHIYIPAPLSFA